MEKSILSDEIKNKAINLLENYAGISQWEEDAPKDVKKRKQALDALRTKLESAQPPPAKMPLGLERAKHKVGDLIIIKAPENTNGELDDKWVLAYGKKPYYFEDFDKINIPYEFDEKIELHNMYFALLCVEIGEEPHSQYVDGYYDRYGIYAVYDYMSYEKPTIEELSKCGFLPYANGWVFDMVTWPIKAENIGWTYKSKCDDFSKSLYFSPEFEKLKAPCEVERFNKLASKKNFNEISGYITTEGLITEHFSMKHQFKMIDIKLDNMINSGVLPELKREDDLILSHIEFWIKEGHKSFGIIPPNLKDKIKNI